MHQTRNSDIDVNANNGLHQNEKFPSSPLVQGHCNPKSSPNRAMKCIILLSFLVFQTKLLVHRIIMMSITSPIPGRKPGPQWLLTLGAFSFLLPEIEG